ncbi:MAG: trimeric autotransporter adhesin, partial [Patescibacteria group bacterium]|nr:trimeric autotransporter adhesin [Patescibacteria group bacterium]
GATGSATVQVTVLNAPSSATQTTTEGTTQTQTTTGTTPSNTASTGSGRYLIDFGHPDYQTTATGWNNIYSGHEANVALVDSTGAASPLTLSVTPALPVSFGNTNGTTAGPYPGAATQDSFFTSTTGYYGSPAKFTYTINGLSASRTYSITLYASRIGTGGEVRTALYTVGSNKVVLNAAENVSNSVTIANITPVNGQIVVTQEKDPSNNNANGFSYLGAMEITARNVVIKNTSQLASVLGAMSSSNSYISEDVVAADQTLHTFTRNLKLGMSGPDVRELQRYLNTHGFPVAIEGEGSLGYETANFGQGTKKALGRLQNAHADEILAPAGLTEGSGVLGTLTRQYINTHP